MVAGTAPERRPGDLLTRDPEPAGALGGACTLVRGLPRGGAGRGIAGARGGLTGPRELGVGELELGERVAQRAGVRAEVRLGPLAGGGPGGRCWQMSHARTAYAARDEDNRLLWRMPRTRLDAESVRDAVLQVAGKLDLTLGVPSVKQFIQLPAIHVTPGVDYLNFDVDRPENARRSVYRFLFRTLPDPFMETLDCADSSQLTPVRNTSVTALQALATMNNKLIVRQSEHLAERVKATNPSVPDQIVSLYNLILNRPPTAAEQELVVEYAQTHGLANACRMLLNCTAVLFLD